MYVDMTDVTSIEKLLTVEDVMANLRISRPTLYRLLKSGHLTPVRIGKRTLFDPLDIRAFVTASKQPTLPTGKKSSRGKKLSQPRRADETTTVKAAVPTKEDSEQIIKKPQKEKPSAGEEDKQGRLL
jgi:excisionase family DNA binding protein